VAQRLSARVGPLKVTLAFAAICMSSLAAQDAVIVPLAERAAGAERVIVGRVAEIKPLWRVNQFGDRLIVSRVHVMVDEMLKGPAQSTLDLEVEGGSIGGLTLHVSDQEPLSPGDRGVFYVARDQQGTFVLHLRGQGFLRLDSAGRVPNSSLTLDEIRRTVASSRAR